LNFRLKGSLANGFPWRHPRVTTIANVISCKYPHWVNRCLQNKSVYPSKNKYQIFNVKYIFFVLSKEGNTRRSVQGGYYPVFCPKRVLSGVLSKEGTIRCTVQGGYYPVYCPRRVLPGVLSKEGTTRCSVQRGYYPVYCPRRVLSSVLSTEGTIRCIVLEGYCLRRVLSKEGTVLSDVKILLSDTGPLKIVFHQNFP